MKICSFRPLCFLALAVIAVIAAAFVNPWLAAALWAGLTAALFFIKVPKWFKIATAVLTAAAIISFVLTTALVGAAAEFRTYDTEAGLRGAVLRYAKWYLDKFLSPENAELMYSLIFGDKSGLPYAIKSNFAASGLSHALAVSGLHVGLVFAAIWGICRLVKIPKKYIIFVTAPVIIFYAYLCGWQYSILRAAIMCLTFAAAKANLHAADTLSTLSLSAIIILILFPYSLVSASFLLSFSCVFGIILLYRPLKKLLYVDAVAVYLAVTVATFPFVIYFFGSLPTYGIIASVVLLPLLVASFYVGLAAVSTFFLGAILYAAEPLLSFVRAVTDAVARLPFSAIPVSAANGSAAVLYLTALAVCSRFVFLKPRAKAALAFVLFACYFVTLMI